MSPVKRRCCYFACDLQRGSPTLAYSLRGQRALWHARHQCEDLQAGISSLRAALARSRAAVTTLQRLLLLPALRPDSMASWPSALLLGTVQVVQAVLCAVHLFLFLAGPCPSHMDLRWTFSCRLCILPRRPSCEASTCGPASGARSLPSRTRPTWISSRGTCFSSGMRLLSGSSECFLAPCFSRYMSPVACADTANLRIRPGPADSVLDLARLCFRELGRTPSAGARVSFVGRQVRPIMTAGK